MASVVASAPSFRDRQAIYRRRHPEWWVGLPIAFAWLGLLAIHFNSGFRLVGIPDENSHASMVNHVSPSFGSDLWTWSLMSVAMMIPVALPALQFTALNSLRTRRQRAMVIFLAAYIAVWMAFGIVALAGDRLIRDSLNISSDVVVLYSLMTAALWQISGPKRRALIACAKSVPLRPFGLRADASCVHYGLQQSFRCLRSCWALMLVMVVAGHAGLLWMSGVSALVLAEELTSFGLRLQRWSAAGLVLVAAGLLVVEFWG